MFNLKNLKTLVSRTFIPDFDGTRLLDSVIRISKQDVNYSDYEKEVVTSQASLREKNKIFQLCNSKKVLNEVMMSRN